MPSLADSLSQIPFYGAYRARQSQMRDESADEMKQAAGALSLAEMLRKQGQEQQAAAREQQFRQEVQGLGPNPTQEQLAAVGSRYAGPKELMETQQKSLDRQATIAGTAATNAARLQSQAEAQAQRLEQQSRFNDMTHEYRMSRAQTDAERAAETARHNQASEGVAAQRAQLDAQLRKMGLDIQQQGLDLRRDFGRSNRGTLPAPALRMQQEELDAIGTASAINADLGAIQQQITDGKLKLSLPQNVIGTARNAVGLSDENSRNLSSFRATLEKLRNDSLRLNKGVQTEGDSQRAWNELIANINDQGVVNQRLDEIQKINKRAADIRRMNVDGIRRNYNAGDLDTSGYQNQPPAVGGGATGGWGIRPIP